MINNSLSRWRERVRVRVVQIKFFINPHPDLLPLKGEGKKFVSFPRKEPLPAKAGI